MNDKTMPAVFRKKRQMIYIGDKLQAILDKHKLPLSSVVNMLAERYTALTQPCEIPMMDFHADLYCNVLEENERPMPAKLIASFPALCRDYLKRHPEFPQGPGGTACMIVENSSYHDLVALVDRMEKTL